MSALANSPDCNSEDNPVGAAPTYWGRSNFQSAVAYYFLLQLKPPLLVGSQMLPVGQHLTIVPLVFVQATSVT